MTPHANPVWFITGCSTGFGRDLARECLSRGWRVAVTARNPDQIADFAREFGERALTLKLDVTDPAQREAAYAAAVAQFGQIDILVNNAGIGYFSSMEEADLDAARTLFEANFFATAALMQLALPAMRARRSGHIVNISSIAGFAPFAAISFYAATKHALEGLCHAARLEVEPLGIKITCVEPGGFRTEFANRALNGKLTQFEDYAPTVGKVMTAVLSGQRNQPGDPVRGARAIVDAVMSASPPRHLALGKQCYEAIHTAASNLIEELEDWRDTALSADYPPGE